MTEGPDRISQIIDPLEKCIYGRSPFHMAPAYPAVELAFREISSIISRADGTEEEALKQFIFRLDRLSGYCERSGHKHLAYRLDMISDQLETPGSRLS